MSALLRTVPPMLAKLGPLPHGTGWAFEMKYDGVRAISHVQDGVTRVLSRNDNDVSRSYPELAELGRLLTGRAAILDGEVVSYGPGGRPDFARLQHRMHTASPSATLLHDVPVTYLVFDVLHCDDRDLTALPYAARRDILAGLLLAGDHVRLPPHYLNVDGETMLRSAELAGLEGVVAKRLTAPYRSGKRSADWTKVPLIKTQEVVIIGWKPGEGRRAGLIGSLLSSPSPTATS
jgi:bifunctional non-homologous end joining protein LigD